MSGPIGQFERKSGKDGFFRFLHREGLTLTQGFRWQTARRVFVDNGGEMRPLEAVRALELAKMVTRAPK